MSKLTPKQRKQQRNSPAAAAARARKAARPWQRALARVRQLVADAVLPAGCIRVIDAMARCHFEHGAGIQEEPLYIGYGDANDPRRVEARAKSTAPRPVFIGVADEADLSRRWAIICVGLMVQAEVLRRWYGGPRRDHRENVRPVVHPKTGEPIERLQGLGGTGHANGYTVEGIPDPVAPRPPEPRPAADERPEPSGATSRHLADWRRRREEHERERLRRLAERKTHGP